MLRSGKGFAKVLGLLHSRPCEYRQMGAMTTTMAGLPRLGIPKVDAFSLKGANCRGFGLTTPKWSICILPLTAKELLLKP